jgi:hypothetical protein
MACRVVSKTNAESTATTSRRTTVIIPEHGFAVDVGSLGLKLSSEHDTVSWLDGDAAH